MQLNALGFGPLAEDGVYGPATAAAYDRYLDTVPGDTNNEEYVNGVRSGQVERGSGKLRKALAGDFDLAFAEYFKGVAFEAKKVTDEILEWLRPRLARWALPDAVVLIEAVPKTSVGKFDKKVLRAQHADGHDRAHGGLNVQRRAREPEGQHDAGNYRRHRRDYRQ